MTEQALTDILAGRVLGWTAAPDRFVKSARAWLPKWRFQPLVRIEDAFQLLDAAASSYRLEARQDGMFIAEIRVGNRTGNAAGEMKARTITLAIARALGIDVEANF